MCDVTICCSFHVCLHLIHYLAQFEAVFGYASISITVELGVVGASSFSSLFFSFAPTSRCSPGFPAVGCNSGGAGGKPQPGEAGEVGDAGEAGETGDGGDVGEVGDGGERGGDGGGRLGRTSLSTLSSVESGAGAAEGSELCSAVLIRASS